MTMPWLAPLTALFVAALPGKSAPVIDLTARPDAVRAQEVADMKWGMFVCWSFSTFSEREWTPTRDKDASYFKATGCDTDQWCRTAKEAGMGYILFLAKHHDGFCLWDTATTDKKVTKSPLGIDVLAKLRESCDKSGIKLALYFSEGDWNWPGAVDGKGQGGGSHPEMKKAQLKELLTNFGPVEYIWFDHAVGDGGLSHEETDKWVAQLQPNCLPGYNHGKAAGRIRLGEMGRPSALDDPSGAGFNRGHMKDYKGYIAAEFTYPILPRHSGPGAMWFYSVPALDHSCLPARKLYQDYVGAVRCGNIFSIDVGPDFAGKLREIDVRTLREVGKMIRDRADAGLPLKAKASASSTWSQAGSVSYGHAAEVVSPSVDARLQPLGGLAPDSIAQGWGSLQTDKSVSGALLTIAGRVFARGLGTHSASRIVYDLAGEYESFSAWVGVDDFLKNHPDAPKGSSVVFQVLGDGRLLFDSGIMRMGDAAREVKVGVTDVMELTLVVTDAGDGTSCDHADWGDPVLTGGAIPKAKAPVFRVTAPGLTLMLDEDGRIAGATGLEVSGGAGLRACRPVGETRTEELNGGGRSFVRRVADRQGRTATLVERFLPDGDGIRWEVDVTSTNDFWSTPLQAWIQSAKPAESLLWTAWGSPDFSGSQLTPELAALVQTGKASVSGPWNDPLNPVGFVNRTWHYGNVSQACPVGADYIVLPLCTILAPATDTGLSLVLSPEDVLLDLDLHVSEAGRIQYSHARHRLGRGRTSRFIMHLVPHEASWRGGVRFLAARYPAFFDPPNPRAHRIAGCGAYSICEAPVDVEKFRKMAFGFNWKLSDDFPYMGMFIPPVKDAGEQWRRSCAEPCPPGKGPMTSTRQMNDYARYMKTNGFSVLSYFNVTEYGKNVNPRLAEPSPDRAGDPELWKDCSAYLKAKLPQAWLRIAAGEPTQWGAVALPDGQKGLMSNCYGAAIVDPGDPDYLAHLVEQAARNIRWLPETDGICIDRTDWLRFYNINADDGVSWSNHGPTRSLYRSWAALMSRMGPLLHRADKVIFSNMMTMRLELCRELDGIYTEFGNNGCALNGSALLGLRKPVVAWTYNDTLRQPGPDAFMQRHLHLGVFPTAPYPFNNHCITPEPSADRLYLDYGPLLGAMRGKTWVLAPRCVETTTPGVKVNLFAVPGGYALPVTFGGAAETACVQVRNVPGLERLRAVALHPGVDESVAVDTKRNEDVVTLTVPLVRGCAMITWTETPLR